MRESQVFAVRMFGDLACFTRPDLKVERVSYEVITPSAARGVLEAICWKPAIHWNIQRIDIHADIQFISFKRNEVRDKARLPSVDVIEGRKAYPSLVIDDHVRQQRNTLALRDVDYVVWASFSLTDAAGPSDNLTKFTEMFTRRLARGQYFRAPYLGCREFACSFEPAPAGRTPLPITKPLGYMLHDIDYGDGSRPVEPRFFYAKIDNGIVRVPPFERAEPRPEGAS